MRSSRQVQHRAKHGVSRERARDARPQPAGQAESEQGHADDEAAVRGVIEKAPGGPYRGREGIDKQVRRARRPQHRRQPEQATRGHAVERGRHGAQADHQQEDGAQGIEAQRQPAGQRQQIGKHLRKRRSAQQHLAAQGDARAPADHGSQRGEPAPTCAATTDRGAQRAERVPTQHEKEKGLHHGLPKE